MPDDYKETLAKNLCRIHGKGKLSHGRSGTILYLPCPTCLSKYGKRELKSQHLAVRMDEMVLSGERGENAWVATCMKNGCAYKYRDMLGMAPISVRIPGYSLQGFDIEKKVHTSYPRMTDSHGVSVPFPPGDVIPITMLPGDHPAREYLEGRNFNLQMLWDKFLTSFCVKELPRTKENGVYYRPLVSPWRSTPQGRVVFFAKKEGSLTGWQSRIIEKEEGDLKFTLRPDGSWVHTATKVEDEWVDEGDFQKAHEDKLWPPPKYRNAVGQNNGDAVFGYDYLVSCLEGIPMEERVVVLTEGPLDAARFGFLGIPVLGKTVQKGLLDSLRPLTNKIIMAGDNDTVGKGAATRMVKVITEYGFEVDRIYPPKEAKDFGELPDEVCLKILNDKIKNT